MKIISPDALAALEDGSAIVSGAVEILADPPVRAWGGWGPISLGGNVFDPVGDRGLVQVAGGALGSAAQGTVITLSGVEEEALALLAAEDVQQAPMVVWRLIFAGDGITLLDAQVWERGRVDELIVEEEIGGTASITLKMETPARGLGRRGARLRSDADQRLVSPTDGFYKNVAFAAQKMLYWGGRKPTTAGSVVAPAGPGIRFFENGRDVREQ